MNDAEGDPIEANDGESCLFKDIARDANGNLSLTLGDGKVITLPIQQVLNLTLSTAINTTVVDPTVPATIEYELHGEHAAEALVGIAEAEGVEIVLDRKQQRITVTFPTGFDDGYMIAMAYDLQEHTVLRPVFFTKATSDRIEIRTAEELVQFAENVNAGTGAQRMTAVLMNDIDMTKIASWIPIGNGSFVATASESKVEGAAFEGTFDGQGHALLNCKMTEHSPRTIKSTDCSASSKAPRYGTSYWVPKAAIRGRSPFRATERPRPASSPAPASTRRSRNAPAIYR